MNFGLDFDGVVTEDSYLFASFVKVAKTLGHKVYIVTMRFPSECIHDPLMQRWLTFVDGIIPTSRQAKRKACEDVGILINVWIDDNPEAVYMNAMQIWGSSSEEGLVVIEEHKTGTKSIVGVKKEFPDSQKHLFAVFDKKLILTPEVKESTALYLKALGYDSQVEQN